MPQTCYSCGSDAQLVNYSQYCQRCYDAWERLQEEDAKRIFGSCVGRPRQYASNAERQKAYRERLKKPKALRNSLDEIQRQINLHNLSCNPMDLNWIAESTRLFTEYQAARRAVLAAEQDQTFKSKLIRG